MLVNVPQYIDVEDKVAGPLTAKQLGWLFAMGAVLFMLWSFLDSVSFYISAIPVALIFMGLAFARPYGRPLITLITNSVTYVTQPKRFIWKREYGKMQETPTHSKKEKQEEIELRARVRSKEEALNEVMQIGHFLDTEGQDRNEQLLKILAQRKAEKKK